METELEKALKLVLASLTELSYEQLNSLSFNAETEILDRDFRELYD